MASPVTLVLVAVPPNIRHALTRWMIEPAPGVFVGTISRKVKDELWAIVEETTDDGWALLVESSQTEQGFNIRTAGNDRRHIIDHDGITLVTTRAEELHLENRRNEPQNT